MKIRRLDTSGFSHLEIGLMIIVALVILGVGHKIHQQKELNKLPATSSGQTEQAIPASQTGFVHEVGTQLLNGSNTPLKLKGVNLGGWLEWEGWLWGKGLDYIGKSAMLNNLSSLVGSSSAQQFETNVENNYVTQADYNAIAADGYNVVRVPFDYRILEDDSQPYVYKSSGWKLLDNTIAQAEQANVYVILDMHAAPCSQTKLFTADYTEGSDLMQSSSCQNRMYAMWKAIASRYETNTTVAGYDILNEPETSDSQLLSIYQKTTAAIRQVDKNHLIIYEGNGMARSFSFLKGRLDNNQTLSLHDYSLTHPLKSIATVMQDFDATANAQNSPLFVGEFGQSGYTSIKQYANTFDNDPYVAAYTLWTWKQVSGQLPTLQQIHETAASQKLIDWMNNTSRAKPTIAEANQGMSDFINSIEYQNTTTDRQTESALQ